MRRIVPQRAGGAGPPGRHDRSRRGPVPRQGRLVGRWHLSQWVAGVAGLLLVLFALGPLLQRPGAYWARTEVSFEAPRSVAVWQQDLPADASLIPFAAAVERAVTGEPQRRFNSDAVALQSFTARDSSVRLADSGGQWVRVFDRPTLVVEAVDPDPDRAAQVLGEQVARIREAARELQRRSGVAEARWITVSVEEPDEGVTVPSRREQLRGGVVVLGLGGVGGLLLALGAGSWERRRRGPAGALV